MQACANASSQLGVALDTGSREREIGAPDAVEDGALDARDDGREKDGDGRECNARRAAHGCALGAAGSRGRQRCGLLKLERCGAGAEARGRVPQRRVSIKQGPAAVPHATMCSARRRQGRDNVVAPEAKEERRIESERAGSGLHSADPASEQSV